MPMPLHPSWEDIAVRLLLTMVAAAIIGVDRSAQGHAAGLRTTMLVGLAACAAMVQANILLEVGGKSASSFSVMDVMRLPLGILTGVGFIGAGTILRRGHIVSGVTTAATLWVMTVIGLCFGGDQLALGGAATGLGFVTLRGLKWLDTVIPREQHAMLVVEAADAAGLVGLIAPLGYHAKFHAQDRAAGTQRTKFEVIWKRAEHQAAPMDLLDVVGRKYKIVSFALITEPS